MKPAFEPCGIFVASHYIHRSGYEGSFWKAATIRTLPPKDMLMK